jgi:hypothetical protein
MNPPRIGEMLPVTSPLDINLVTGGGGDPADITAA